MENISHFFCEECREFTEVEYVTVPISETVKNISFTYDKKKAICTECNSEIFIPELHDENLNARLEAYKESSGIITKKSIQEILSTYGIGKRPLSLLLGWGELTVTRYLDNSTPSKEYSDILKKISKDPFYYYSKLMEGYNNNLITETAYNKSLRYLQDLFAGNKLALVAHYIIAKESLEITPLALQKLLYYISGFYSAFYSTCIFRQQPEAWKHGPVYKAEYHKYKNYKYNVIDMTDYDMASLLNEKEKNLIDEVINAFGIYGGKPLEYMTHIETPWLDTRGGLPEDASCDREISNELMETYFKKVIKNYSIERTEEIKKYAKKQFELVTNQ